MNRLFPCIIIIMVFFISSSLAENEDTYSHAGMDGIVLAENNTWYLEEFDSLGRPFNAVRWEKKTILETTTWLYFGDSQNIYQEHIVTENETIIKEYDTGGNLISIKESFLENQSQKNAADRKVPPETTDRVFTYVYDSQNRLRESVSQKEGFLQKEVFEYQEDGTLSTKSVYKNGSLAIIYTYRDEENWTETVYYKDLAVLTVIFKNGERQRIQHETW